MSESKQNAISSQIGFLPKDWKHYSVGSLGEVITGKTPSTSRSDYFNGEIPFVTPVDLGENHYILKAQSSLTDLGASQVRILPPNTILVTCIGILGKVGQSKVALATNQQINSLIPGSYLYPNFGYWVVHLLKPQLEALAGLQVVPIVNKSTFSRLLLPIPPLPEQRRIAEVLDTVDAAIQQTEALIAKLKLMKAGLLHDLLTRGLDEHGQLRDPGAHPEQFKDSPLGRIPKEWKVDILLNCVSLPNGQLDPKQEPYRDWPLIAPDHIESGTGRLLAIQSAAEQNAISGKYGFQPGDVLYSKIRPYLRKAVLADRSGLCSADMYPLRPGPALAPRFLLALILGEHFSRFATAVSMRSGFPKINREELAEYRAALPSYEEQVRISAALDAHDARIRTEEAYCDKLKQLKKGLMRDLLTGRVRVQAAEAAR